MTNYGVPSSTAVYSTVDRALVAGVEIAIAYEDLTVAAGQDLAALTVVTLNEDNQLVPATKGTPAIGFLAAPVRTAAGETATVNTVRAGVFYPEGLIFASPSRPSRTRWPLSAALTRRPTSSSSALSERA